MSSLYNVSNGDFTPYVKYNAKAARWYVRKDSQDVEVQNPVFVADFANVKKAWMYFKEGQAPDVQYFESITDNMPKPSENHKLGLSINLFSENSFGGVVKLESNSANTCSAISELYDEYNKAPESKEGKLPVVKVEGAEAVKGNYGTNFKPKFRIEKWVARPAAFDEIGQSAPANNAAPAAADNSAVSEF